MKVNIKPFLKYINRRTSYSFDDRWRAFRQTCEIKLQAFVKNMQTDCLQEYMGRTLRNSEKPFGGIQVSFEHANMLQQL